MPISHKDFFEAIHRGELEVIQQYIEENDADVNEPMFDGDTPLYVAARYGNHKVVKILLENGADLNKVVVAGSLPLAVAARLGHLEVVKLLLEKGAEVNKATANYGATPLYLAAQNGHF